MKKALLLSLVLLFAFSLSTVFAGGAEEEVIDVEATLGPTTVEGVIDIDYSGWARGRKGGRFVRAALGDPKTFNGVVAAETSTTDITDLTESGSIRRSQLNLEFEPAMAERWEVSDDQTSVTVYLKEGLKFSDGEPITAHDYVFTMNHLILREDVASNSRSGYFIAPAPGEPEEPALVELIDDYTYRLTLPTVYAGLVSLAGITPYPQHVFAPVIGWDESVGYEFEWEFDTDDDGNKIVREIKPEGLDYSAVTSFWGVDMDVTELVASGPYLVSEYIPGQRVVFEPNPNYWETDEWGVQLPYLDEVVYRIIPDQDTTLQAFIAGEIDSLGMRGEDYAVLVGQKEELGFEIYNAGPDAGSVFITFNQNPIDGPDDNGIEPPELTWLSNKTFRVAMAHLVDRQTIINNVSYGIGLPQYSPLPRQSPYYFEGAEDVAYKYDPVRAAELLDSIDYIDRDGDGVREDPDGNRISLNLSTNSGNRVREAIGELFSQEASKVGIEINFTPKDFNALVGQLVSSYDWELILIGLTGVVDPISSSNTYPSSGSLHMIEPNQTTPRRDWEKEIDDLWVYSNNTTDEAQRKDGFEQIQRIWMENVPMVYTFNSLELGAYKVEFGNIKLHPFDAYGFKGAIHRFYVR
jgi:peptide/nickel transport system substrate-binding protein